MAAPNLTEIEHGIYRLLHEESSKYGYILLAALYTCRNEILGASTPQPQIVAHSEVAAPINETLGRYGDSEFLRAVEGLDPEMAWAVMDEHMDALHIVNPRAYDGVMRKLHNV